MVSQRKAAPRASTAVVEAGPPAKDKNASDSTPPRAGRTGNLGAKAERPAENRAHKSNSDGAEPGRSPGKAPSPAAKGSEAREGDLPQPVRDSST